MKTTSSIQIFTVALAAISACKTTSRNETSASVKSDPNTTLPDTWKDVTVSAAREPSTCVETPDNCTHRQTSVGIDWIWIGNITGTSLNWNDAKEYCEQKSYNGQSDWRLPSLEEYKAAFADKIFNLPTTLAFNKTFRTSTEVPEDASKAFLINMISGTVLSNFSKTVPSQVMCIRP